MQLDKELLKIVSEDLNYLAIEWNQDIDDASLRRASPVLRSLLVEGKLSFSARQIGKDIRVLTPAIHKVYTDQDLQQMRFWQAGGAKYKGMQIQAASMINRALSAQEIKVDYERTKSVIGKNYPVKLSVFMRQPSIVVEGNCINREEIIKYVANKLGGAHYDSSRKDNNSKHGLSLEDKYVLLDSVHKGTVVADKNAIYYELLSIGQRLVNSRDIRQLRKTLKNISGRPDVVIA